MASSILSPSPRSADVDGRTKNGGGGEVGELKDKLAQLKAAFQAEQDKMKKRFTDHQQQLKLCTTSLHFLTRKRNYPKGGKRTNNSSGILSESSKVALSERRSNGNARHPKSVWDRLASPNVQTCSCVSAVPTASESKSSAHGASRSKGEITASPSCCRRGKDNGSHSDENTTARRSAGRSNHPKQKKASASNRNGTTGVADAVVIPRGTLQKLATFTASSAEVAILRNTVARCEGTNKGLSNRIAAVEKQQQDTSQWRRTMEALIAERERAAQMLRDRVGHLEDQGKKLSDGQMQILQHIGALNDLITAAQFNAGPTAASSSSSSAFHSSNPMPTNNHSTAPFGSSSGFAVLSDAYPDINNGSDHNDNEDTPPPKILDAKHAGTFPDRTPSPSSFLLADTTNLSDASSVSIPGSAKKRSLEDENSKLSAPPPCPKNIDAITATSSGTTGLLCRDFASLRKAYQELQAGRSK